MSPWWIPLFVLLGMVFGVVWGQTAMTAALALLGAPVLATLVYLALLPVAQALSGL